MDRLNQSCILDRSFAVERGFDATSKTVYVTSLPYDIEQADLKFLFSLCGPVKRVKIHKKFPSYDSKYRNTSYVFAYIEFHHLEAKEKAKKFYNGKVIANRPLKIQDYSFKPVTRQKPYTHQKPLTYQKPSKRGNWDQETICEEEFSFYERKPSKKVHSNQKSSHYQRKPHTNSKETQNCNYIEPYIPSSRMDPKMKIKHYLSTPTLAMKNQNNQAPFQKIDDRKGQKQKIDFVVIDHKTKKNSSVNFDKVQQINTNGTSSQKKIIQIDY